MRSLLCPLAAHYACCVDDAAAFGRASDGFVDRLRRVTEDQWNNATPCTEWNVRALVNHVAGEYLWVPEMMAGRTIADVGDRYDGDVLGSDPVRTVSEARDSAVAAFSEDGAMQRTVHLSFGEMPAGDYAQQMTFDSVIHAWDLARGIGADERLDPELVELTYAGLAPQAEAWRSGGAFAAAKEPAGDSTQAKLLALTGR